ncbi:MAG TPA: hypothetical protein VGJ07_28525 [Rugosimonospora sp.]|jgi:hypothetical protein
MRLKNRLITTLALGTVVTALTGVGLAAPAQAASIVCCSYATDFAASVSWDPDGEHYYLEDSACDGHSAVIVNFRSDLNPSGPYYGWNPDGCYTTKDYNLNMPEGTTVWFQACLGEYGTRTVLWDTCGTEMLSTA